MKKLVAVILALMMVATLGACRSNNTVSSATRVSTDEQITDAVETQEETEDTSKEDELTADMAELEAIGAVEVENGLLTVSVTLPTDFVTDEVTQEKLDADAGDNYLSAKLNEDGSVTYKMTKAQHRAMLDGITEGMEESLQEMINDDEKYGIAKINHNGTYSVFDVTMDTDKLGLGDSFTVIAFYMYGGMYGIFSGNRADNVIVNFYDPAGNLIQTGNSANMAN
jgi:hypothetical protein